MRCWQAEAQERLKTQYKIITIIISSVSLFLSEMTSLKPDKNWYALMLF